MIITGGEFKGRRISAPDSKITRPTLSQVRMGVFNVLYSILGEFKNLSFLDVFGGSGIMGLEALSRGFEKVTVLEKNPQAAKIIKNNYLSLGVKPELILGDSLKILKNHNNIYDVIYIDPPYKSYIYEDVFSILKLAPKGIIAAEHSETITINDFELIKTKSYGGKFVSFFTK